MDVQEAARRLEVSASTVYGLCGQGRMPHSRVGLRRGVIRISEDDMRVFLEGCRAEQATPAVGLSRPATHDEAGVRSGRAEAVSGTTGRMDGGNAGEARRSDAHGGGRDGYAER
jgi:excisionase family DNA binding protein